jgi:iron complex outermembrane receptor protein
VRDYVSGGFVIDENTSYDKSFSRFNPTATVAYNISDTLSTYGKVATGYRSGGASESASDFRQGFGPETLLTYEVGMKADWLDRRLRTNIAVFYSDYKDIQLDVLPDASNINIVQTYNAGQASISGLEADILFAATEDLQFSLGYSYLDTEVKKASVPGTSVTAGDFVIPYAPENSVNLGVDWTILQFTGGSLSTALNYAWKDSVYNTGGAGEDIPGRSFFRNDPYGFLDGKITVQYQTETIANPVKISLWGRNLLDKRVPIFTSAIGSAAQGYTSSLYNYSEPLTMGVEVSFSL